MKRLNSDEREKFMHDIMSVLVGKASPKDVAKKWGCTVRTVFRNVRKIYNGV